MAAKRQIEQKLLRGKELKGSLQELLLSPYSGEVGVGESRETLKAMDVLMENDRNEIN